MKSERRFKIRNSDIISMVMCLAGGVVAAASFTGIGIHSAPLAPGRYKLGILLAVLIPFFAALSDFSRHKAFRRWVLPAILFSTPLLYLFYIGIVGREWSKCLAGGLYSLTAFGAAFFADWISRANLRARK